MPWLMVAPALVGFALFYGWPAARALEISTTDWNLLQAPHFVGLSNYRELWHDPLFWNGLKLAGWYVLLNIPLQTALGLVLAVLMDRLTESLFVRAAVLLPYLLSNVLVAMLWLWLLDPFLGLANRWLMVAGWARQPFFGGVDQALWTIAGVNIWRHTGMIAMLFLAGLKQIPRHLYEAAAMEGATPLQMFWRITLPLLRPVMVFVLVTSVTGSFQIFDTVAVTTNGGPLNASRVIVYYIVQNAFGFYRMGYATAMSMTLCALMALYTVLQMRILHTTSELDG